RKLSPRRGTLVRGSLWGYRRSHSLFLFCLVPFYFAARAKSTMLLANDGRWRSRHSSPSPPRAQFTRSLVTSYDFLLQRAMHIHPTQQICFPQLRKGAWLPRSFTLSTPLSRRSLVRRRINSQLFSVSAFEH